MAKKRQPVPVVEQKAGVDWKVVKPSASMLSEATKKLYKEYFEAFQAIGEDAKKLKEAAEKEWKAKNDPKGTAKKVRAFNAIGGVLLSVMKDKEKPKAAKKKFEDIEGEDVSDTPPQ